MISVNDCHMCLNDLHSHPSNQPSVFLIKLSKPDLLYLNNGSANPLVNLGFYRPFITLSDDTIISDKF
jgi:hypothetical protein